MEGSCEHKVVVCRELGESGIEVFLVDESTSFIEDEYAVDIHGGN